MGIADGLAAAVGRIDVDAPGNGAGEQLDLLAEGPKPGVLGVCAAPAPVGAAPAPVGAARRGRKPGSQNRNSREWAEFLLRRHRSPLVTLARLQEQPLREMAEELELVQRDENGEVIKGRDGRPVLAPGALMDCLRVRIVAADKLAPYVHQRQPLAVEAKGDSRGLMVINLGLPDQSQQDQGLTLDLVAGSHDARSHDEGEPLQINDLGEGAD